MDKIKYITSGGVACPQCGSHNITGGDVDWDEPLTRPVECNECGAKWVETLRPADINHPDGNEIAPDLFPIHQIFDMRWIGVIRNGEMEIHGPFVADQLELAVERLGYVGRRSDLFEVTLTPDGHLFTVRMDS